MSEVTVYLLYQFDWSYPDKRSSVPRWCTHKPSSVFLRKGLFPTWELCGARQACSQSVATAHVFFPSKDNLLSTWVLQSQSRKLSSHAFLSIPPSIPYQVWENPLQVALGFQIPLHSIRVTLHYFISQTTCKPLPLNCSVCATQNHCLYVQDTSLPITKAALYSTYSYSTNKWYYLLVQLFKQAALLCVQPSLSSKKNKQKKTSLALLIAVEQ